MGATLCVDARMRIPNKLCRTRKGWVNPKGRIYPINLELTFAIPPLYAHKSLSKPGWTITEHYTGGAVGYGKTKKLAIKAARERILKKGESSFKAAIRSNTINEDKR